VPPDRRRIGTHGPHVDWRQQHPAHQHDHTADGRHQRALIEDQVRVCLIFASNGLRDQRHGPDTQHRVATKNCTLPPNSPRHRRIAEARDKIQIHQIVHCLKIMPAAIGSASRTIVRESSGRQILHGSFGVGTRTSKPAGARTSHSATPPCLPM
jgi:hypothetical protein